MRPQGVSPPVPRAAPAPKPSVSPAVSKDRSLIFRLIPKKEEAQIHGFVGFSSNKGVLAQI